MPNTWFFGLPLGATPRLRPGGVRRLGEVHHGGRRRSGCDGGEAGGSDEGVGGRWSFFGGLVGTGVLFCFLFFGVFCSKNIFEIILGSNMACFKEVLWF